MVPFIDATARMSVPRILAGLYAMSRMRVPVDVGGWRVGAGTLRTSKR